MNFEFTDEQRQLHESIDRYLTEQYAFERFKSINASEAGWNRAQWQALADIGVLGLNVPAAYGGLGFGPLETLAMMGACGRSLVLEPVLSSAVIGTALLSGYGEDAAVAALLGQMAAGEKIAVPAHFERDGRFDARWVSSRAHLSGGSYILEGHKAVVMHAPAADVLLVSARTSGQNGEGAGVSLFRVPKDAAGLTLESYPTLDGQRAADVYLKEVKVDAAHRIGAEGAAFEGIDAALDVGLALCAEAVGVMQALVDATVQYVQTRQQFGQPIGKFQALQHRIAEMLIHLEQARSMSYLAALRCSDENVPERKRAMSAAKTLVGQACRFVSQQAVQLHGGMGMTDELVVSHWFKRLTAAELMFGDSDTHLQRYAALTR
jgi:alkylation response protein AidB-like acyl-CoA dehydrogenase